MAVASAGDGERVERELVESVDGVAGQGGPGVLVGVVHSMTAAGMGAHTDYCSCSDSNATVTQVCDKRCEVLLAPTADRPSRQAATVCAGTVDVSS